MQTQVLKSAAKRGRAKAAFAACSLLLSAPIQAKAPPGGGVYLRTKNAKGLQLIVSESYKKDLPVIYRKNQRIYERYQKIFPKASAGKSYMIFISPRAQALNGQVVISPLPIGHIYSGASPTLDLTAAHNWLEIVLTHETAHLFQLNTQSWLSSKIRFLPRWFWAVYPNIYMHKLILEGHATLLESIYSSGGRLFSGWARAFVFSQLKNRVPLKRIFNDFPDPFSIREKYLHGAYFMAFLMQRHTLQNINLLFERHSRNILFPIGLFSLNLAFKKTFNESFTTLFAQYRKFYLPKAEEQQSAEADPLLISYTAAPINSDSKHLYFLISSGKGPPQLAVMDKNTNAVFLKTYNMPLGKVFRKDGSFYSAGAGHTSTMDSQISLFANNYTPLKKYNSRFVMDIQNDKVLSFPTDKGPHQFSLFVNDKFYSEAHSTGLMDAEGNIYYFKQSGGTRSLYRNKTALFSYPGHYGFPVEAREGVVYFIGPVERGSGFFAFKEGQVFRLSPSDVIVQARHIKGEKFLALETGPYHYTYKVITAQWKPAALFSYTYPFLKQPFPENFLKQSQSLNTAQRLNGGQDDPPEGFEKGKAALSDPDLNLSLDFEAFSPALQAEKTSVVQNEIQNFLLQKNKGPEDPSIRMKKESGAAKRLQNAAEETDENSLPNESAVLEAENRKDLRLSKDANPDQESAAAKQTGGGFSNEGGGLEMENRKDLRLSDTVGQGSTAAKQTGGGFSNESAGLEADHMPKNSHLSTPDLQQRGASVKTEHFSHRTDADILKLFQPYHPLPNLKFARFFIRPIISFPAWRWTGWFGRMDFIDPLQRNQISLAGAYEAKRRQARASYLNRSRRLYWGLEGLWEQARAIDPLPRADERDEDILLQRLLRNLVQRAHSGKSYHNILGRLLLEYPLFRNENKTLSIKTSFGIGQALAPHINSTRFSKFYLKHRGKIHIRHFQKYSYAFAPYKYWDLSFSEEGVMQTNRFAWALSARFAFEREWGREWYFSGAAEAARAIRQKKPHPIRPFKRNKELLSLSGFILPEGGKDFQKARLSLKKPLHPALYSIYFPVSLKRFAPLGGVSVFQTARGFLFRPVFFAFPFIGAESEFSTNHQADIILGFSLGRIYEMEYSRLKKDHGVHGNLYLKGVF